MRDEPFGGNRFIRLTPLSGDLSGLLKIKTCIIKPYWALKIKLMGNINGRIIMFCAEIAYLL